MKLEIEYVLECLPEDVQVRGNAMASGDAEADRQAEAEIISKLNHGNQWAWCTVKVTARVPGIDVEGVDYLGCCSYDSEGSFREDGYYQDMCAEARHELIKKLCELKRALMQLEVDELEVQS